MRSLLLGTASEHDELEDPVRKNESLNAFLPFSSSVLVNDNITMNITSVSVEKSWVENSLACTHRISARRSAKRNRTQFSMQNQRRRAVSTGGACTYTLDWQNYALRLIWTIATTTASKSV